MPREGKNMEQYLPLILSAVGGGALGPIVSKLLGGGGTQGLLGGVLGGVGAHFGADAASVGNLLGDGAMAHVQSLLEGGIGGGVLGLIAGKVLGGNS